MNEENVSDERITDPISTLQQSITQLKQEVELIKKDIEDLRVEELLNKVNSSMNKTDNQITELKKDLDQHNERIQNLRSIDEPDLIAPKNNQSEYRQIQTILHSLHRTNPSEKNHHEWKPSHIQPVKQKYIPPSNSIKLF
ncbi:hypothetical protein [Gracilibacillus dipsosauri]|uniref:hypothetical protein n=1 Tax=Gracilibacillus dipsosauri TaxID=178340 RepID=UPI00240A08F4